MQPSFGVFFNIYLFGCTGSLLLHVGFFIAVRASLWLWRVGFLFSSCGLGSTACRLSIWQHAGSPVEAHKLSSCGTQA